MRDPIVFALNLTSKWGFVMLFLNQVPPLIQILSLPHSTPTNHFGKFLLTHAKMHAHSHHLFSFFHPKTLIIYAIKKYQLKQKTTFPYIDASKQKKALNYENDICPFLALNINKPYYYSLYQLDRSGIWIGRNVVIRREQKMILKQ